MKSSKSVANKKCKPMDYTNYAYNEAVSRLKLMLAESYAPPRGGATASSAGGNGASGAYMRHVNEDSTDNYSDNLSVIERPVYSDISKYLSPAQKSRLSPGIRTKPKAYNTFASSKENLTLQMPYAGSTTTGTAAQDYYTPSRAPQPAVTDSVHAPVEIFNFIEKQEDYIEQLEKESKYCRNELSNLLGKVKDVINENTHLTETARSELAALSGGEKVMPATSPSSDSDEQPHHKKKSAATPRNKKDIPSTVKSPRYASAPNIVYEARISELEAELMQANIDLKRLKTENEELKRKLAHVDPLVLVGAHSTSHASATSTSAATATTNCDLHRKQIEQLQNEKHVLEESVRHLQKLLDEAKSQQYQNASSKRYVNDLVQMERAQAELEVKHLREELDRQHERVRELQHEMARRIADERATAERRYNTQVDQLGGDLSSQWEQVAKLQLDLEREKRYATDLKRDLSNRNAQIEELKMELRSNRNTFLADMAQVNAEKQSLEQEITSLRLQLDRAAREAKTEATRLTAEISSLRQRLDRGDADLLHSKREVLRLNDEIANLEKELAYGEMKNEIRPTKKDLDKRISEMQEKHAKVSQSTTTTTAMLLTDIITTTKAHTNTKTATSTATAPTTARPVPYEALTVRATNLVTPTSYALTTTTATSGVAWFVPSKTQFSTTKLEPSTSKVPTPTTTYPTITSTITRNSTPTGTKPKVPLVRTSLAASNESVYVSPPKWSPDTNEAYEEKQKKLLKVAIDERRSRSPPVSPNYSRHHRFGSDEDILTNITKSNEKLERELAKMPPLPTMSLSAYRRQQRSGHLYRTPSVFRQRSASDEGRNVSWKPTFCGQCGDYGTHCSCSKYTKHIKSCTHFEPMSCTCCCRANSGTEKVGTAKPSTRTESKPTIGGTEANIYIDTTTSTAEFTTNPSTTTHTLYKNCRNHIWDAQAYATINTPTVQCRALSRLRDNKCQTAKRSLEDGATLAEETSAAEFPAPHETHQAPSTLHCKTSKSRHTTPRHIYSTSDPPVAHNTTTHCTQCARATIGGPKFCTSCNPQPPTSVCSSNACQVIPCHPHGHCKTEPLPWLQQHLVLNQTFSGLEHLTSDHCHTCQSPRQGKHLTVPTESTVTRVEEANQPIPKTTANSGGTTESSNCKPRAYFEELLRRDECCAVKRVCDNVTQECGSHAGAVLKKKPRPPVKVDVNVRLVPKSGRVHKEETDKMTTTKPIEFEVNLKKPPAFGDEQNKDYEKMEESKGQELAAAIEVPDLSLNDFELDDCGNAAVEE